MMKYGPNYLMGYNPRTNAKMGKRSSFYVGLAKLKECKPRAIGSSLHGESLPECISNTRKSHWACPEATKPTESS